MEPGNKFLISGYCIAAHELPVHNQTTCVNHENDTFVNERGDRFYSSPE
jgi:hypothetical protein